MVHLRDFALHCENAANGIAEAVFEASRKMSRLSLIRESGKQVLWISQCL